MRAQRAARPAAALPISWLLLVMTTLLAWPAAPARALSGVAAYAGVRDGSGFKADDADATPLTLRSSGAASLAFEWPYDASRRYQLFVSQQRTRLVLGPAAGTGAPAELALDVRYLHIGGTYYFDGPAGTGPYVVGGLGLTYLTPRLPGTDGRVRASMNLGIGWEWPLAAALALRAEYRGYATVIHSSGSFFCSGGCTVSIQGDTLTQGEVMVGLRFGF